MPRNQNENRGFASMSPEKRRKIARLGGQASRGGRGRDWQSEDNNYGRNESEEREMESSHQDRRGRRGFASMDPEERRRIASMGGRASHGGRGRDWEGSFDYEEDDDKFNEYSDENEREFHDRQGGRGRRGFASMESEGRRDMQRQNMRGRGGYGERSHDYESDYEISYDDSDYNQRSEPQARSSRGRRSVDGRRSASAMSPAGRRGAASKSGRKPGRPKSKSRS